MEGFNFTDAVKQLCWDITQRCPEFQHVRMDQVAVGFAQTRNRTRHGMWASLTSLRFENGALETVRRGRRYRAVPYFDADGREMLYILRFYLPRFLDLPFWDALSTVVHELWHISPQFDGDIRRFPGRCASHGRCKQAFDDQVDEITHGYLRRQPAEDLLAFLRLDYRQLRQLHGRVFGQRVRQPKMIPV